MLKKKSKVLLGVALMASLMFGTFIQANAETANVTRWEDGFYGTMQLTRAAGYVSNGVYVSNGYPGGLWGCDWSSISWNTPNRSYNMTVKGWWICPIEDDSLQQSVQATFYNYY